jgi:hypothetical protein
MAHGFASIGDAAGHWFPPPRISTAEELRNYQPPPLDGYENHYDKAQGLDLEPRWVPPDVRDFYRPVTTSASNGKPRWVFVCPCCGFVIPFGAALALEPFRRHIRDWRETGQCASPPGNVRLRMAAGHSVEL